MAKQTRSSLLFFVACLVTISTLLFYGKCVNAFQPTSTKQHHKMIMMSMSMHRGVTHQTLLMAKTKENENSSGGDDDLWAQQKALVQEMTESANKSLRQRELEKYARQRNAFIGDIVFLIPLIFSFCWAFFSNPFVAFSYVFGATLGLAYAYGLAKYVETLGGSVDDVGGAGAGQARFAFLILLFVFVGKFRSEGLLEIPAIGGFFTYQLASLGQALREFND